jgi:undecaprenyl-diphosphatase
VDSAIALELHQLATSQTWITGLVVVVANYGIFLLPLSLLVVWLRGDLPTDRRRDAILVGVVTAGLAFLVGLILERTLSRPRPFVEAGFQPLFPHAADSSFPSDHTLVGVAMVGPLLVPSRKLGVVLVAWALVVGLARVSAGVHYPSDVLGSAVLALVLDGLVWVLSRPVRSRLNFQRWDVRSIGSQRRSRRQ